MEFCPFVSTVSGGCSISVSGVKSSSSDHSTIHTTHLLALYEMPSIAFLVLS